MESYVILASKNWGNDTFDEDGYTIDSAGVEITGLAKKITDHDIQQCKESNSTIISFNIPLPTKAHLDKNHFIYAKIMNHLLDKVKKQF